MRAYLDTSVIYSMLAKDALNNRAEAFLRQPDLLLLISDFGAAEFASIVARKVRVGEITPEAAAKIFSAFDKWRDNVPRAIQVQPEDIKAAEMFIRRLDLTLRAPDALHIAMARRAGAVLATFDTKMAASAKNLGLDLAGA